MHVERDQALNLAVENKPERHDIEPLNACMDLGVILSPELKNHDPVDVALKKARNTAFLIRWMLRHLPPKVIPRAYTALMRQCSNTAYRSRPRRR